MPKKKNSLKKTLLFLISNLELSMEETRRLLEELDLDIRYGLSIYRKNRRTSSRSGDA